MLGRSQIGDIEIEPPGLDAGETKSLRRKSKVESNTGRGWLSIAVWRKSALDHGLLRETGGARAAAPPPRPAPGQDGRAQEGPVHTAERQGGNRHAPDTTH